VTRAPARRRGIGSIGLGGAVRRIGRWLWSHRSRILIGIALVVALLVAYLGWFRNSSLVAVNEVRVVGVSSADRERITAALTEAGERMTTLHVDQGGLEAAVSQFPTVASVTADPDFPHAMTIRVRERQPALVAEAGGERVALTAQGLVLRGVPVNDANQLPVLRVSELPSAGRLRGDALAEAQVLGAAPEPLAPLIDSATYSQRYGVVVEVRGGIPIRFGSGSEVDAKWAAAAALMADPSLTSVTYLDVRVPRRPAAGGTA
jgi:cell division protein FtsQ